jgi:glycine cleavage system H protein
MKINKDLKYSKEHEWVKVEGNKAYVGISDFAQHSLGNIVFIELPELQSYIGLNETVGVVESVKAASDIYSPISGTVVEVNELLSDAPEMINNDPYEAWITVIEMEDVNQLESLMNADEYTLYCSEEE